MKDKKGKVGVSSHILTHIYILKHLQNYLNCIITERSQANDQTNGKETLLECFLRSGDDVMINCLFLLNEPRLSFWQSTILCIVLGKITKYSSHKSQQQLSRGLDGSGIRVRIECCRKKEMK
jgi:hypothetical protein